MSILAGNWQSGVSGGGEQEYTTARISPEQIRRPVKTRPFIMLE
jgi:hypothetical protein